MAAKVAAAKRERGLVVIAEGLVGGADEMEALGAAGVDGVLLGEELVASGKATIKDALFDWKM